MLDGQITLLLLFSPNNNIGPHNSKVNRDKAVIVKYPQEVKYSKVGFESQAVTRPAALLRS